MYLESTDAAGRVPHLSPTWPNAVTRASVLCLSFFFFSRIHADSASIRTEPSWFGQNRAVSAISGRISRRLKQAEAEIGLESSRNSQNSHLKGIVMCFLPSSFFVLWVKV